MIGETPETLVECRDAGRTYGTGRTAVVAVHGANCRVLRGDRIAVVGRSGSGKSTLLHLMAGLDVPTTGIVAWPAWPGTPSGHPGRVGVVFQGPSLLPALDVAENVALPAVLAGVDEADAAQRADESLRALAIHGLARKLPGELSEGQAQRVAVARVLAARPALILADEPTGRLDRAAGDRVIGVLLEAADTLDAGLVVATHDEVVAVRMDQRWQMLDGRLTRGARPLCTPEPPLARQGDLR